MSVKRAQREIDSAEFSEWMAYSVWEPFGPEREDQRAGMVAALIANVNRDPKHRPQPYDVEDFFPRYEQEAEEQEQEADLESKLMSWVTVMSAGKEAGREAKG